MAMPSDLPAGVDLQKDEEGISEHLLVPTGFASVDAIYKDKEGALKYHYSIIEVRVRMERQL